MTPQDQNRAERAEERVRELEDILRRLLVARKACTDAIRAGHRQAQDNAMYNFEDALGSAKAALSKEPKP